MKERIGQLFELMYISCVLLVFAWGIPRFLPPFSFWSSPPAQIMYFGILIGALIILVSYIPFAAYDMVKKNASSLFDINGVLKHHIGAHVGALFGTFVAVIMILSAISVIAFRIFKSFGG